jgi:RNA polymerase sigma factor (sigma-70 family)
MPVQLDQLRSEFDRLEGELRAYLENHMPRDATGSLTVEDVLQEVWLTAAKTSAAVRDPEAVKSWLRRITERKLIDALRYVRRPKHGGGVATLRASDQANASSIALFQRIVAEQRTPSSVDAAREGAEAVKRALDHLPEHYRRAMTLYYIDGLSRDEVARAMSRSAASVNSLLYRGLMMLRSVMGSPEKFFSNG